MAAHPRNGNGVSWLIGLVAAVTFLSPSGTWGAPGPVQIGVITSISGGFATFGRMEMAGYKVAAEELNARGGVQGRPVELLVEDDASSPDTAIAAAKKLMARGVPLIVGAYASSVTKPLAAYLSHEKFLLVNGNSADTSITKPGSPYVFRVGQTTDSYAAACFDLIRTFPGVKTVAILVTNDALGKSTANSVKEKAKALGLTVVGEEAYNRGPAVDFRPLLASFKAQQPDVVALSSYEEDASTLMRQAKEVDLSPKVFAAVGASGYAIPQFINTAREAAEFVFSASPWRPEVKYPGALGLYARFRTALGGEPSHHAAKAYAGMLAAGDAIQRAGSLDREAIRKALEQTKLSSPFGPISFESTDGFQNQNPAPSLVIQVQDRKFVVVWPKSAASGAARFPTPPWGKR